MVILYGQETWGTVNNLRLQPLVEAKGRGTWFVETNIFKLRSYGQHQLSKQDQICLRDIRFQHTDRRKAHKKPTATAPISSFTHCIVCKRNLSIEIVG